MKDIIPILLGAIVPIIITILLIIYFNKRGVSKISMKEYNDKKENIIKELCELKKSKLRIISERKSKKTSINDPGENLFGADKKKFKDSKKLNLKAFNSVIELNETDMTVNVESNISFETLINFLLKYGYQPVFTVDQNHISVGGFISGVGGGSACAKQGAFHDSVVDMDVLTSECKVLFCSKKENKNLFYSIPNSYGSLGYILRAKIKIELVKPYVRVDNLYFNNAEDYFNKIKKLQEPKEKETYDFLEGTVFDNKSFVLMVGKYVNDYDDYLFDPIGHRVYWKQLRDVKPKVHYFKVNNYNWRWDVDGYYTTIDMGWFFTNEELRPFVPRFLMKGTFLRPFAEHYLGVDYKDGNMVNDIIFPTENAAKIFEWYDKEIGLYPLYICPVCKTSESYFFNIPGNYVDFGVGYGPTAETTEQSIIWKRKLEMKMLEENGTKLLYSKQRMDEDDFWKVYENKESFFKQNPDIDPKEFEGRVYDYIKKIYDPSNTFPSLFEKVS